jgi:hypothetical protein
VPSDPHPVLDDRASNALRGKDFGQSFGSDPVAGPPDWRDDPAMDQTPSARATLDMETVGAAPAGTLISADGVARRFTGWTEFASAIQEWRAAAAAGAETETSREPGSEETRSGATGSKTRMATLKGPRRCET